MARRSRFSAQTLAVLAALEADPAAWRHGYLLAKETGLRSGTLYPILIRLADRGLVEACWEDGQPAGRPQLSRPAWAGIAQGRSLTPTPHRCHPILVGHVAQGQEAARRHRVPELPDDPPRVFVIPQAVQDTHEHDPDRLAEVERAAYLCVAEHLLRFAQIRPERDDAGAGRQRGGIGRNQRVNVHVDDARPGRRPVGDLVGAGHAGQAGAKVEELADALAEQVVDHPLQQMAALQGSVGTVRDAQRPHHRVGRFGRLPIDREVVLAAELIVPDPGRVGITGADRDIGARPGGRRRFG